jgi:carbon-monoxide dehydrogenase medium subunit
MNIREYRVPVDLDECLTMLGACDGRGRIIAGGTDLVPAIENGRTEVDALIDIGGIRELEGFEIRDGALVIHCGATHGQIAADPGIGRLFPALSKACASVGSPQIRNIATIAGNVVNAQPAADAAVALVALGAWGEIVSSEGRRLSAIEDLYKGFGKSGIDSTREILTGIRVPLPTGAHVNIFGRISPRNSLCLPIVNAAVSLNIENGIISSARIAMGPVADRPFRPQRAEAALCGLCPDDRKALAEAARIAGEEADPRDSCLRGCSDYRRQLLKVLVRTLLHEAAFMAERGAHGA